MTGRSSRFGVRIGLMLAAGAMAWSGTGCESGDFVAPPPLPSRGGDAAGGTGGSSATSGPFVTGSPVRSIEMVQARDHDRDDALTDRGTARAQAGFEKSRIRVSPDDEAVTADAAARRAQPQAELVRQAVARKPQALIVEPEDSADAELARAVGEALAAKVPVVVMGRPIAGVEKAAGGAPLIVVGPPSFAGSGRRLVELSIRNARNAKLDPHGGAILLVPPPSDRFLNERIAAVRDALVTAKITTVDELLVPKKVESAAEILKKRLLADPKPSLVFTFDFVSTSAANSVNGEIIKKRPFIQSGYTSDDSMPRLAVFGEFGGLAEFAPARLVQRAVTVAVGVAQGRSLRDKEEVGVRVVESPEGASVPHIQAERNAGPAARAKLGR